MDPTIPQPPIQQTPPLQHQSLHLLPSPTAPLQQQHQIQHQPVASQPPPTPPPPPPPLPPKIQQPPPLPRGVQQSPQTHHHPQSTDACANIVRSLLHHSCGESDFSKRAIESLVKKMKEKRDELDALITAITTSGSTPTPCVTIQRTLDGRLQVAGRKGFPHVIYARIWRWPDLTRNELRATKHCQHAFNHKSDLICVNPFHYDRVVSSPGIDIASLYINSPENNTNGNGPGSDSLGLNLLGNSLTCAEDPHSRSPPILNHIQQQTCSNLIAQQTHNLNHHQTTHIDSLNRESQVALPCPIRSDAALGASEGSVSALPPNALPLQCSSQPLPDAWCSIGYFELDQQIGGTFRVPTIYPGVTIDGFTNPTAPDQFCIGFLTNPYRPEIVRKARLHIGKGVRLETRYEGDVWLQNLSDNAVFLSSPYLDQQSRRPVGNAVHKIYPRASLKVFDLHETHQLLSRRAEEARRSAELQAAAVVGTGSHNLDANEAAAPAIGVDDLRRFCILSMSFVKGWGPDYPRNSIKNCPCWVEVHLHRALQLLDEVLRLKL